MSQKLISSMALITMFAAPAFAQTVKTTSNAKDCEKVRAAFDIGSEKTKLKVFKINVCTGKIIGKPIYPATPEEKSFVKKQGDLPFEIDLRNVEARAKEDGIYNEDDYPQFSGQMLSKALKAITRLKETADSLPTPPTDYVGVATEAFRRSTNSELLIGAIERLGVRMLIPAQPQEGLIEWMSVTAATTDKDSDGNETLPKNIVSWGIGGGSMQLGMKLRSGNFGVFTSKLASVKMHDDTVQRTILSGNLLDRGLTKEDIDGMISVARAEARRAPDDLKDRIQDNNIVVYGIGGVINNSLLGFLKVQGNAGRFFTPDDVKEALDSLVGRRFDDPIFGPIDPSLSEENRHKYQELTAPNLALIYGFMKQMRITRVYYLDIDNTFGAPFTKEFGIKMVYKKPVPVSKQNTVVSSTTTSSTNATSTNASQAAPVSSELSVALGGDNGENLATCEASTHSYSADRKYCFITDVTMQFRNWCTGGLSADETKCYVKGKPTLVYKFIKEAR